MERSSVRVEAIRRTFSVSLSADTGDPLLPPQGWSVPAHDFPAKP